MPVRDPKTGKFLSEDDVKPHQDVEYVRISDNLSVPAAQVDGSTGLGGGQEGFFEGFQLLDYAEITDRHEVAQLAHARHRIVVYTNSTTTADGTVRAAAEISANPDRKVSFGVGNGDGAIDDTEGGLTVHSDFTVVDDSADVIGPGLEAVGFSPFSDGATGVGGAGEAGTDEWEGLPGGDWSFDRRDELFLNGVIEQWNVADAALHMDFEVYHEYVIDEC